MSTRYTESLYQALCDMVEVMRLHGVVTLARRSLAVQITNTSLLEQARNVHANCVDAHQCQGSILSTRTQTLLRT